MKRTIDWSDRSRAWRRARRAARFPEKWQRDWSKWFLLIIEEFCGGNAVCVCWRWCPKMAPRTWENELHQTLWWKRARLEPEKVPLWHILISLCSERWPWLFYIPTHKGQISAKCQKLEMLSGPKYRRHLLKIHGTAWIQPLQTADLTVGGSEAPPLAMKMSYAGMRRSIIYLTVPPCRWLTEGPENTWQLDLWMWQMYAENQILVTVFRWRQFTEKCLLIIAGIRFFIYKAL